MPDRLRSAMWHLTCHDMERYLQANASGGPFHAKGAIHRRLVGYYVAVWYGLDDLYVIEDAGVHAPDVTMAVHLATQQVTSYLDEAIGFPVDNSRIDYAHYTPLLFAKFHEVAVATLAGYER